MDSETDTECRCSISCGLTENAACLPCATVATTNNHAQENPGCERRGWRRDEMAYSHGRVAPSPSAGDQDVERLGTIARQLSQRPLKHLGRLAALNQVLIIDDHGGDRLDAAIRVKPSLDRLVQTGRANCQAMTRYIKRA